jgi:hypothetical protein
LVVLTCAGGLVHADPPDAVCRLTVIAGKHVSCGSGTVIAVEQGRSSVLTCAHLFGGGNGRILLDAPMPNAGAPAQVGVRLVQLDHAADLALVEVGAALPYTCPVGETTGRRLLSCGYDYARGYPGTRTLATPLGVRGNWLWTRELPVDGRSGGPLIDVERGTLVGVCHGYQCTPYGCSGMYVCLDSIHEFLGSRGGSPPPARQPPSFSCPPHT